MVDAHQSRDQGPKEQHHPYAHHHCRGRRRMHATRGWIPSKRPSSWMCSRGRVLTGAATLLTVFRIDVSRSRLASAEPRGILCCKHVSRGREGCCKRGATIHHEHHHHERQNQPHGCVDRAVTCKKPPFICYDLDERNNRPAASQLAVELNAQCPIPITREKLHGSPTAALSLSYERGNQEVKATSAARQTDTQSTMPDHPSDQCFFHNLTPPSPVRQTPLNADVMAVLLRQRRRPA